MEKRIFYSWQSDLPSSSNLEFIGSALEQAIKEIKDEDDFSMIPVLDRDTDGISGSPDISQSIFEKIKSSSIFVCDVSIINSHTGDFARPTPNPNVLIELGYAIGILGWSRIILIMNENFGSIVSLPFDLRGRRIQSYSITPSNLEKASERERVSSSLKSGIKDILLAPPVDFVSEVNSTKIINKDSESDEAILRFRTLKSITYTQEKNSGLILYTNEYIKRARYDLAVMFASEITFFKQKNKLLKIIASAAMVLGDFDTAQKAVESITYIQVKNTLGKELLKRMQL